ncbi:hypothetical protein CBL_02532 [Carabus blaptoides fortunei]
MRSSPEYFLLCDAGRCHPLDEGVIEKDVGIYLQEQGRYGPVHIDCRSLFIRAFRITLPGAISFCHLRARNQYEASVADNTGFANTSPGDMIHVGFVRHFAPGQASVYSSTQWQLLELLTL